MRIFNLLAGDISKNNSNVKLAPKEVDEYIKNNLSPRYVVTRWNSRTRALQKAKDKQLGTNAEQILIEQSLQILNKISVQTDKIQADNASVKHLVSAFAKIKESWFENPVLSDDIKGGLNLFLVTRLSMFR